ncbi:hypothetical protein ACSSV8_002052 [Roseovarius sp. MBR-79]
MIEIALAGTRANARKRETERCLRPVSVSQYGRKELLAMTDGFCESKQGWRALLLDL